MLLEGDQFFLTDDNVPACEICYVFRIFVMSDIAGLPLLGVRTRVFLPSKT